jgi:hypothetical protein
MEVTSEKEQLADPIDGIQTELGVIGDSHSWIEEGTGEPIEDLVEEVCDDYQRLLRIIQLLLVTGRLSREDLLEAADAEDRFL